MPLGTVEGGGACTARMTHLATNFVPACSVTNGLQLVFSCVPELGVSGWPPGEATSLVESTAGCQQGLSAVLRR